MALRFMSNKNKRIVTNRLLDNVYKKICKWYEEMTY